MFNGGGFFNLGDDVRFGFHQAAQFDDVFRFLYEGQADEVGAQHFGDFQIFFVFGGQRGKRQFYAGHVDAFFVGQFAAGDYRAVGGVGSVGIYAQAHDAVVKQQFQAGFHRGEDFFVRQAHAGLVAGFRVHIQAEFIALFQGNAVVFKSADAEFRALQVK